MLIDSDAGTLFAIAPREGFEDAVLGAKSSARTRRASGMPTPIGRCG